MTNLIEAIGEVAGKVWRHLAAEGEQSVSQVAQALDEPLERVTLAVGWLAREGKIVLKTESGTLTLALKENDENW